MFTLAPWDHELKSGIGSVQSSTDLGGLFSPDGPGVMFDAAERVTYACSKCGAKYPARNDAMVRRFLQAVVDGEEEIRLWCFTSRSSSHGTACIGSPW